MWVHTKSFIKHLRSFFLRSIFCLVATVRGRCSGNSAPRPTSCTRALRSFDMRTGSSGERCSVCHTCVHTYVFTYVSQADTFMCVAWCSHVCRYEWEVLTSTGSSGEGYSVCHTCVHAYVCTYVYTYLHMDMHVLQTDTFMCVHMWYRQIHSCVYHDAHICVDMNEKFWHAHWLLRWHV